uniref:Uncharacterized protein n=1 Tax=Phlebotomus papatasi TaxID=29031 RepID=A0A1B0GNW7_PHLPP
MQFPAMRRLCIATANAFLLVYATTSAPSFGCVKQCFDEIREQRADFQEIPIVIAGNKLDLASTHREVKIEDVSEWVFCELPKLSAWIFTVEMSDFERIRLVILGGAGVGKSCIVKRFLFKTYSDKYRATVEDLYNREYDLGAVTLKASSSWSLFFLQIT